MACLFATICTASGMQAKIPDNREVLPEPTTGAEVDACISRTPVQRYLPVDPDQVATACNLPFSGPTAYACRWQYLMLYALSAGPISVAVSSSDFDPVAYIYCSGYNMAANCVAFDDDDGIGVSSLLQLPAGLPIGTYYYLYIYGYGPLDSGCFTVSSSANAIVIVPEIPVATESNNWGGLKRKYR